MPAIHRSRPPSRVLDPEGSLTLLAPQVAHAPALVEAIHASLPALRGYMPWAHLPQTPDTQYERLVGVCAEYWRGDNFHFHLVDPARPDVMLGCVGLHPAGGHRGALEVGYWIRSDRAGHGLATRAARLATWLAFARFGCVRVQCVYEPTNAASARVAEKVGFEREAILKGLNSAGTDAMRANGWTSTGDDWVTSLAPERARAQPWWGPLEARVQLWDWRGEPVS